MEIDLEILDMLMADASAKKEYWSAKVGYEYNILLADSSFQKSATQTLTPKASGSKLLKTKYKL